MPMKQPKVATPKIETIDVSVYGMCANCGQEVMMQEINDWFHTGSINKEC